MSMDDKHIKISKYLTEVVDILREARKMSEDRHTSGKEKEVLSYFRRVWNPSQCDRQLGFVIDDIAILKKYHQVCSDNFVKNIIKHDIILLEQLKELIPSIHKDEFSLENVDMFLDWYRIEYGTSDDILDNIGISSVKTDKKDTKKDIIKNKGKLFEPLND